MIIVITRDPKEETAFLKVLSNFSATCPSEEPSDEAPTRDDLIALFCDSPRTFSDMKSIFPAKHLGRVRALLATMQGRACRDKQGFWSVGLSRLP